MVSWASSKVSESGSGEASGSGDIFAGSPMSSRLRLAGSSILLCDEIIIKDGIVNYLDGEGGEAVCNGGGESSPHPTFVIIDTFVIISSYIN